MFAKPPIETKLEEEITSQLSKLSETQDAEEYGAAVDRISKLHKLKTEEANTSLARITAEQKLLLDSRIKLPSADTLLAVGANLFGILWLTRYEREKVISSKALGFVMKPR